MKANKKRGDRLLLIRRIVHHNGASYHQSVRKTPPATTHCVCCTSTALRHRSRRGNENKKKWYLVPSWKRSGCSGCSFMPFDRLYRKCCFVYWVFAFCYIISGGPNLRMAFVFYGERRRQNQLAFLPATPWMKMKNRVPDDSCCCWWW